MIARLHLLDLVISTAAMLGLTAAGGAFFSFLACAVAQRRLGKTDASSRKILKRRMRRLFLNRALLSCCAGLVVGLTLYLVEVLAFSTSAHNAAFDYGLWPFIFVVQAWAIALKFFPRTVSYPLDDPLIDGGVFSLKYPVKPEDLKFLQLTGSGFTKPKPGLATRVFAVVFFTLAVGFAVLLFHEGIPHWPLSTDRWIYAVFMTACLAAAVFFWRICNPE